MKFRKIIALELTHNKKGDLFCRLMSDLFHALGYDEPRFDVHKSGREIDLQTVHRIENKIAIAECKAHKATIGGSDINKFVGALDAEKRKHSKSDLYKDYDVTGYFVSLSGYKETAIEQELDNNNDRLILLKPEQIIDELVKGRIIVPLEKAVASVNSNELTLEMSADLIAYNKGWVWAIYYSNGQRTTHVAFVHAEGKLLVKELSDEIIKLDKKLDKNFTDLEVICNNDKLPKILETQKKYFKYLENECGEIHFEGLPTDKDAGSVKVRLENIFITPSLEIISNQQKEFNDIIEDERISIGNILNMNSRLAILAKPGGGKSTLIKRLAIAYAFPSRKKLIDDNLPKEKWFPIFIRCRELGEKVTSSITEIIHNIPNRAEINDCSETFVNIISNSLQKGTALLLIDGLDEISDDRNRISFVNQLRTFIATYPNIHIVITSREAGFRAVGGILANYCANYKLSPLNSEEIESLSIKWHTEIVDNSEKTKKEAVNLAKIIINDNRIKTLAENPLLLTTLLFVKRWAGYLPTRKSVLYQEMIKLLMVTWNVEGHEQLDIEEAEPQLAYVAFWMTSKGEQTITLNDLKKCLLDARKQMPDILGYTKISIPDFIKRVESRSSLLIMSGHKKVDSGEIVQIYEFLHLSFQEHLTAKAVVEKFLPISENRKSTLDIIKPHIEDESWKEVIPLVAVLLRRDSKELIEHLIELSIISQDDDIQHVNRKRNSISPAELLGSCIANEIQITPELLDNAIEWYSKNRYRIRDKSSTETILNSKFREAFKDKIHNLYFEEFNDKFSSPIGSLIGEVYINELKKSEKEVHKTILADIKTPNRETQATSLFGLMIFCFENKLHVNQTKNAKIKQYDFTEIVEKLLTIIKSDDKHLCFPALWSIAWFNESFTFSETLRVDILKSLLEIWNKYDDSKNLNRVCTWAIKTLLSPNIQIDKKLVGIDNIESIILKRFNSPLNEYDKLVSVFLSVHLSLSFDKTEVEKILIEENKKHRSSNNQIAEYAERLGVKFNKKESQHTTRAKKS
ncbi:restriction endonuclease [Roseivirga ehrenbergii]|nr:NACHT domain-containing protein [Roseivirga ehrenbergii]TCL14222.1 restriction endonuclease [Roseivirga ehrenbergii]